MARTDRVRSIITPVLDVMQTIPSFVYLIPIIMLLGIGNVPGLLAVCISAMPPIVRLTNLGIRLVDKEVLEAAAVAGGLVTLSPTLVPLGATVRVAGSATLAGGAFSLEGALEILPGGAAPFLGAFEARPGARVRVVGLARALARALGPMPVLVLTLALVLMLTLMLTLT